MEDVELEALAMELRLNELGEIKRERGELGFSSEGGIIMMKLRKLIQLTLRRNEDVGEDVETDIGEDVDRGLIVVLIGGGDSEHVDQVHETVHNAVPVFHSYDELAARGGERIVAERGDGVGVSIGSVSRFGFGSV
nr:hypothetical protein CFP56_72937 [Quercus suber]